MAQLSDALRTIAARLCKREETQLDGRMLLAHAEAVAALESENAEIHEAAGDLCLALNDQQTALTALVGKLTKRPTLPVDGAGKLTFEAVEAEQDTLKRWALNRPDRPDAP